MHSAVAGRRLQSQRLTRTGFRHAADVVAWFGAMQAQEYAHAKWAIGLRMPEGTVDADIQRAFDDGRILRTHVMRPTWHFVAPADIRWLLELTAPRVHRNLASHNRTLELDARTLTRGTGVIERALRDGRYLTRPELGTALHHAGLPMAGPRLANLAMHAELEAVICSGPRRDKKMTYALVAERAPDARRLRRDEALATLASRFLTSHGPATIRDFVWWSGLTTADAKRGLEMIKARREDVGDRTYWSSVSGKAGLVRGGLRGAMHETAHLLPIYDEYLVAYRDRDAVPHASPGLRSDSRGSIIFQHALVIAGQVAGAWRPARNARGVQLHVAPLRRLTAANRGALTVAVGRYQRFLNTPVDLTIG
jgi:hypothetical protein